MLFKPMSLAGAFSIEPERIHDERGFFARNFCKKDFQAQGLEGEFVQSSVAFNKVTGTLRGMHFQAEPYFEVKLVRCTMGKMYDVLLDLRPDSPTYLKWQGVELSAANGYIVYAPKGIAHGYQTLEDNTEVEYHMSEFYRAEHATGVRWNDPAFKIEWPKTGSLVISPKDKAYPDYAPRAVR